MFTSEQVKKMLKDEETRVLRSKIPSFTDDNSSLFALLCSIRLYFAPSSAVFERKAYLKNIQYNNLVQSLKVSFKPNFFRKVKVFFQNRDISVFKRAQKELEITVDGVTGKVTPFNITVEEEYEGNNFCYNNSIMLAMRRYVEGIDVNAVAGILRSPEYLQTETEDVVHCVVEKDGMINDMLRHCAFSKELYNKLFCFEELEKLSGEKVFEQLMYLRSNFPESIRGEDIAPFYVLANEEFMEDVNKKLKVKEGQGDSTIQKI